MQSLEKKNIVIFGGNGFLGNKIFHLFSKNKNNKVLAPTRNQINLTDQASTEEFIKAQPSYTLFINCAAVVGSVHSGMNRESRIIDENTRLNLNIFTGLSGLNKHFSFINFLSNCIYPETVHTQIESQLYDGMPHHSARAYAHTKRHAMQMFNILAEKNNASVHQLILPGLFGAGNHLEEERLHAFDAIIVRMIKAKRNNKNIFEVYGTGSPIREWVPARTVAEAVQMIDSSEKKGPEVLNFSIDFSESIWDTTLRIKRLLGYTGKIVQNTNYIDGAPIKILDNKLFRNKYPEFHPAVDIDAEVQSSINYYENNL